STPRRSLRSSAATTAPGTPTAETSRTSAKPPASGRLLSRTRTIGSCLRLLNRVSQSVRKHLRHHSVPESIQMSIGREKWALSPLLNIAKRRQSLDVQNRLATEPRDAMLLEDVEGRVRRGLGAQYLRSLGNNQHHELRSQAVRVPSSGENQLLRDPERSRFSLEGGRYGLDHAGLAHQLSRSQSFDPPDHEGVKVATACQPDFGAEPEAVADRESVLDQLDAVRTVRHERQSDVVREIVPRVEPEHDPARSHAGAVAPQREHLLVRSVRRDRQVHDLEASAG